MNIYKSFQTNKNLETKGITVEYHDENDPDLPPSKFIVARAGGSNQAYEKAMDRKTKPIRRALSAGTVSMAEIKRINREVFAETCLLSWENVDGPDGKPLEFNYDNAVQLFKDMPDLFDDLFQQSSSANLFRQVNAEEAAKN